MISEEARSLMDSLGDLKEEDVDSFVEKLKALNIDDQRRLEYAALKNVNSNKVLEHAMPFIDHVYENRPRGANNNPSLGLEEFIEGRITWEEYINYGKSK